MSKMAVWARIPVQPGKRDEAIELLRAAIGTARGEDGTLLYILHEDPKEPDTLLFYELYTDKDALRTHSSSDAFAAMTGALGAVVAGQPTMQFLKPIDGKGL